MSAIRCCVTIAAASVLLLPVPLMSAERASFTVEAAVAEALEQSSELAAASARAETAAALAHSLRGRMLPGVRLADEAQRFSEAYVATLPFPSPAGGPTTLPVRDLTTNTFTATVAQPVLGLLHLSQDWAAQDNSANAALESVKAVAAGVREQVQTEFLRLFEARALADTARASERDLEEEVTVMEARLKTGVVTNADVLRIKVAVANARQQEIQAGAQELTARSTLLAALGRPPDDDGVEFVEPTALLEASSPLVDLHTAVSSGLAHRPELAAVRLATRSAQQRSRARLFSLLPEVSLEAGYVYLHGQDLAPQDSRFIGVRADWAIFEWGASFYEQRAAEHQAAAAAAEEDGTVRRIGTEVSIRVAQTDAANNAVGVAETVIASAEEAYRVTNALLKAGSATTTDLLDAQSALTQARLNLVRAKYEQAMARVALTRATGG